MKLKFIVLSFSLNLIYCNFSTVCIIKIVSNIFQSLLDLQCGKKFSKNVQLTLVSKRVISMSKNVAISSFLLNSIVIKDFKTERQLPGIKVSAFGLSKDILSCDR